MENQDFNKELLEYIYGEMSASERKQFEEKLQNDSALQHEYKALSEVRGELENLKDKEVMEPFSTWPRKSSPYWFKTGKRRKLVYFRPVTAVAASLVILMLLGSLTNFSISMKNGEFRMAFGETGLGDNQEYFSKEEVRKLVSMEVDRSNKDLIARLSETEENYAQKLTALETAINTMEYSSANTVVTSADLQKFFSNAENKNIEIMREYLKMTSAQQQEYFKTMLTQFNTFYQKQREDDLDFVRASLVEMRQSQQFKSKKLIRQLPVCTPR